MVTKHTPIMKRAKEVPWILPWNYGPAEDNGHAQSTFFIPTDAHNYKITGMLKQLKF